MKSIQIVNRAQRIRTLVSLQADGRHVNQQLPVVRSQWYRTTEIASSVCRCFRFRDQRPCSTRCFLIVGNATEGRPACVVGAEALGARRVKAGTLSCDRVLHANRSVSGRSRLRLISTSPSWGDRSWRPDLFKARSASSFLTASLQVAGFPDTNFLLVYTHVSHHQSQPRSTQPGIIMKKALKNGRQHSLARSGRGLKLGLPALCLSCY